jgi:ABC-type glycerol-3-phosphate transport system substrate-binding protein
MPAFVLTRRLRLSRRRLVGGATIGAAAAIVQACGLRSQLTLTPPAPVVPEPSSTPTMAAVTPATSLSDETPTAELAPTLTPAATETPTPAPRTLTWWTGPSAAPWLAGARDASGLLTKTHPEVTIRLSGGHVDFGRIVGAFMSGQAPEVLDVGSIVPFAARGIITSLQTRVDAGALSSLNFYPAMIANGSWRGQLFGIPALDHGPELGFIWNKALASSVLAGSTPDHLSPADGYRVGKLLTTNDSGGGIATLGFDPLDGVGGLLDTTRDLTGQDWIDSTNHKITFANTAYETFLGDVLGYYKELGLDRLGKFRQDVPPLTDSRDSGENRGRQVALVSGYWSVSDVTVLEQDPSWSFEASWAPAVPTVGRIQRLGGRLFVIPSGAREPDGGWALIQHLVGDEGNSAMFARSGRFVTTRSFVASRRWEKWPALQFFVDSLDTASRVTARASSSVASFAEVKWEQTWSDVVTGNRSPADALATAQKAIEAEYLQTGS